MARKSLNSIDSKEPPRIPVPTVSGSDIEEDKFFKIDGSVLPSKEDDGEDLLYPRQLKFKRLKTEGFVNILRGRTYSQDGHGEEDDSDGKVVKNNNNSSFLSEKPAKGKGETDDDDKKNKKNIEKKVKQTKPKQPLSERKRKPTDKAYATDGEADTEKEDGQNKRSVSKLSNRSNRSVSVPKPKQKRKDTVGKKEEEEDHISTDTDGHMCEKCYVDDVVHKKNDDADSGGDDNDSDDSLSSWDSDCAAIYAEVASKEVYDPAKVLKILHTKQYQAEKYLEEQKRLETQRKLDQDKMLEELKKSNRSRKITVQSSKEQTPKPVSYRQSTHRQNLEEKRSEKAPSTHSIKRAQSLRDMLSLQLNRLDPNIPQIVEAPNMANPPKDKYKIQQLVEEMVKQNNKIYKAEKLKAKQEKEEEEQREKDKLQLEKQKLMDVIADQRERYLLQLEEKEANQEGNYKEEQKLHEYEWWMDQRKFEQPKTDEKPAEFIDIRKVRSELRAKYNIDEYFSDNVEKVLEKIKRRKSEKRREVSQKAKKAKEFFAKSDKKQQEENWTTTCAKHADDREDIAINQIEEHLLPKEEVEKVIQERKEKYGSKNTRVLNEKEREEIEIQRRKKAFSIERKKKQDIEDAKLKKKQALEQINQLSLKMLKRSKKKDFSTLSEMDFDFTEFRIEQEQEQLKNNQQKQGQQQQQSRQPLKSTTPHNQYQQTPKNSQKPPKLQQQQNTVSATATPKNPQANYSQPNSVQKNVQTRPSQTQSQRRPSQQEIIHQEEEETEINKEEMQDIDEYSKENQRKVNLLLNGMGQSNLKISAEQSGRNQQSKKSTSQNPKGKPSSNENQQKQMTSKSVKELNSAQSKQSIGSGENVSKLPTKSQKQQQLVMNEQEYEQGNKDLALPDDFIEKIFETAEMADLPAEYVLASERKDERRAVSNSMKKFEREIQNQLYKKNEKPISAHISDVKKEGRGGPMSSEHKSITQSNMVREAARNNNFVTQSKNPTQHLLQGEIEYVESKWSGVREIQTKYRKPTGISEDERERRQKQATKVSIITPEMPPLEIKKQHKKKVSIKEQYEEEYARLARQEQERKDDLIRKQQQFILNHDIEDNIFEMANKAAFEEFDKKRTEKKQDVLFSANTKQAEDEGLYAELDATEAYNNSLKQIVPEVFKNISKSNFASLIKKQKNDINSGGD